MTSLVECDASLLLCCHHLGLLLQSAYDTVYSIEEVLFAYALLVVACCYKGCLVAHICNIGSRESWCLSCQQVYVYTLVYFYRF